MKYPTLILWMIALIICTHARAQNLTDYVRPLIGTQGMGHTFPGATVPFGMVQLSPDTDTLALLVDGKYNPDVYRYCAGYQYDDPTIVGFSHTHFSGTGHSDLGDILVMPVSGAVRLHPGTKDQPEKGYRSRFSHANETASPNYYKVLLEDDSITAELTTTTRVGIHRYTFHRVEPVHVVVDLSAGIYNYDGKNVWTFVRVENDTLVTGYRQTNGWGRTRTVYFAIAFSEPIVSYQCQKDGMAYKGFWRKFDEEHNFPEIAGTDVVLNFDFNLPRSKQVQMKVALSPTSTAGAVLNLRTEAPHQDFDRYRKAGETAWQQELEKVQVTTLNEEDKISFYTALYHTCLGPTIYSDVDGRYKGIDQNIHTAEGFEHYTTFSLWDTYRALHPWFNLVQSKRNNDMVESMLAHYDQSVHHMLPVWSHHANENWCMIGYHAVPVIVDAALNPICTFDRQRALDACKHTAENRHFDGLGDYQRLGFVPENKSGSSVSKTLEYAFDDYCIAQLAGQLKEGETAARYTVRSHNFTHVFDPSIGFMRPKNEDGTFIPDFDVLSTHQRGFIEGNAWNYSLYVPHAPEELINLMGGRARFTEHLDSLFTMELPDSFFAHTEDITRDGIMGNYVHGNEPSHHVIYLFNAAGACHKTQYYVRKTLREMYGAQINSLRGNDDCGQMSAWYLFSSLGFYPVAPSSGVYSVGAPLVVSADLQLENGHTIRIRTKGQKEGHCYVKAVYWNGSRLKEPVISFDALFQGGELLFEMSAKVQNTYGN